MVIQNTYRLVPGTSYPTAPQTSDSTNLNSLGVYDSLRNGGPLTGASEIGAQHPLQARLENVSESFRTLVLDAEMYHVKIVGRCARHFATEFAKGYLRNSCTRSQAHGTKNRLRGKVPT